MPGDHHVTALRRAALAVSVLHDVDLLPDDDGVVLPARPPVRVTWAEMAAATDGTDPETDRAHDRLACWLLLRRALAGRTPAEVGAAVRPLALPVGHILHPGESWTRGRVLGGCLDLGAGLVGLLDDRPDEVVPAPAPLLRTAGLSVDTWWPDALDYLERMGRLAAQRLTAETAQRPDAPAPVLRLVDRGALRPVGDCDVVTLLASRALREAVAGPAGGMRAAAVPMRNRGWLELTRIDPAFVVAAAEATAPAERGFTRPVLLTRDEVALAVPGGRPAEIVLRDPVVSATGFRDVRYHL